MGVYLLLYQSYDACVFVKFISHFWSKIKRAILDSLVDLDFLNY